MARPPKRTLPWIWERILPRHGVHLLCGPTGAGKNTLLHQLIDAWTTKQPEFMGFKLGPICEWIFVGVDRDLEAIWETIDRIGVKPDESRIHAWPDKGTLTLANLELLISKMLPHGGLFILDGIHDFVEDYNNPRLVTPFLRGLRRAANQYNVVVLGLGFSPKMRPGEEYKSPRHRMMGTAAWPHHTDTGLLIEQLKEVGPERRLYLMPRNDEDMMVRLAMDGGKLVDPALATNDAAIEYQVNKLPNDAEFMTGQVVQWCADADPQASSNTVRQRAKRWLDRAESAGQIASAGHGKWRKLRMV